MTTEDGRTDPAPAAPERQLLTDFLAFHRETLLWKVSGLDDAALRRRLVPSLTTLLGMVKHLAYVEQWWTCCVFEGRDPHEPWASVDWDADWDWDWHSAAGAGLDELLALLDREVAASDEVVRRADDLGRLSQRTGREGVPFWLRWVLVHIVEEYARHNGHADLLRESIDGTVGE